MKNILYALLICLIAGCAKKSANKPVPSKPFLVSPTNNAPCNTGINLTSTQSTVTFSWQKASNTDNYQINIKNLLTGLVISQNVTDTQINIALNINTPYSWYLISQSFSTSQTSESDTWKFYNSGPGLTSYAPFPADLISPVLGTFVNAGLVNLTWKGSDPDNDIATYEVYLDTNKKPAILKSGIINQNYSVTVNSKTTYYWNIVTTDSKGNTSVSETFHFSVN